MTADNPVDRTRSWLVALVVGWLALTVAAVVWAVPHQERDLASRAASAVSDLPVSVDVVGRDVALRGSVAGAADLDLAMALVREVRGVRRVDGADVAVAAPSDEPTALAPPQLTVNVASGSVALAGRVPNQAAVAAITRAAETRWGAAAVSSSLRADAATGGAAWLPGAAAAVDALAVLDTASLELGAAGAVLNGVATSEAQVSELVARLSEVLGTDVALLNNLEVVQLDSPSFGAELLVGGVIRLTGTMPSQEAIDAIVSAAVSVHGSANVESELVVGDATADPAYLNVLPGVFGLIDGITPWSFAVEGGAASISGEAVSEGAIATTVSRLGTALAAGGLELESTLRVDPDAVATVLTELLKGSATFRIGSAELSPEATVLLDEAVEILIANPDTVLTVAGHTDDVGSEEANLALSEARAQAVVDYLVAGGVAAERLSAVGFGETQPIADNTTADGRAQNRRIEFVVEQEGE